MPRVKHGMSRASPLDEAGVSLEALALRSGQSTGAGGGLTFGHPNGTVSLTPLDTLLVRGGAHRALTLVALGVLGALALVDLFENLDFMVVLTRAAQGRGGID